uniref:DUF2062 domain-containing protein n=1 Tax=Acrobeloides nanus TaxID=290746 RepID=A0A914DLH5_9BILA
MSVYKKILLQNCVVDTLLAFAVAIAEPAIGPLAVNVLPMLMFMYCIISKADAIILSAWAGLPLAWIPVVNPILTIWFVKPYRMALCPIRSSTVHSEATYGMFSVNT